MNYQPILKLESCRITETYVVEGRTYEAELIPSNPGFCAGMAGFGTYCITVLIKEKEKQVLDLSLIFPKGKNPHQLMALEDTPASTSNEEAMVHGRIKHISPFGEETIEKAVRFYLGKGKPNVPEGMRMDHYTIVVD
jgi:hypothetical protein